MVRSNIHIILLWIDVYCCFGLASGAYLRCYKGSLQDYEVTPLNGPLSDSFKACLDPYLPTLVYTHGYRGKMTGPATTAMLLAYLEQRKRNVLGLDWEEEAKSGIYGIPLGYVLSAVPKAKMIGKEMGGTLIRLRAAGLNMTDMHLMGHSLGAHLLGFTGRAARKLGYVVDRITGLDPSRALFDGTFSLGSGLDQTCGKFVDIIHTDQGNYGTNSSTGSVDIWPNYGNPQPGCAEGDFEMFSPEDLCRHNRSWRFYAESISRPTAFPAGAALDYPTWNNNGGTTDQTIYLGELTNTRARGNFYLTTNANSPFGRGEEGLKPNNTS